MRYIQTNSMQLNRMLRLRSHAKFDEFPFVVCQGVFSRQGSGMCFEFSPTDNGTYVAGTEHGQLHKCSVSYSEQYLDTFAGHKAPVNRLLFSPFWHDVFATCSAD